MVTGLNLKSKDPIRVSQRSVSLHLLIGCLIEEKELNLQSFLTCLIYIAFSPHWRNNNCEKWSKEGKSSDCRLVFRQMNSSREYIGNLRIWTFILFKSAVRYSSIRCEGTGERESNSMLICFWKSFATNTWDRKPERLSDFPKPLSLLVVELALDFSWLPSPVSPSSLTLSPSLL